MTKPKTYIVYRAVVVDLRHSGDGDICTECGREKPTGRKDDSLWCCGGMITPHRRETRERHSWMRLTSLLAMYGRT